MDLFTPAALDEQADPDRLILLGEVEPDDDQADERQIGQSPDGWLYEIGRAHV